MKQALFTLTLLCLLLLCTGKSYGQLTVSGGTSPADYTLDHEKITVNSSTPLTISGNTTTGQILITEGITANVTIDGVSINISKNPIDISANATLNLTLKGENILEASGENTSGLHVPSTASLVINGEGILTASGSQYAAGIGGNGNTSQIGNITIESGTITATGGADGAGIGGGYEELHGTITINGGTIHATGTSPGGWDGGAGIGTGTKNIGDESINASIIITGGQITATGGGVAAGIGAGYGSSWGDIAPGGTITITGGVIIANTEISGQTYPTIGGRASYTKDVIIKGNAAIKTTSISPGTPTAGILFINTKEGHVLGNITAPDNYTVESDETLTIPSAASLTVENGKALINKGTIAVETGGTFTNNGAIHKTGTLPDNIPGTGHILDPFPNIKIASISNETYTGNAFKPTPAVTNEDNTDNLLTLNTHYTLSYKNNTDAGTATVTVTPDLKEHYFGDPTEQTFTIDKAILTVTPDANQVLYQDEPDYHPTYAYSGNVNEEIPAFTGNLKWDSSDGNKIKKNNLTLDDNAEGRFKAANYMLTVDETIVYTPIAENIKEKVAALKAASGSSQVSGWYTGNVIIKAPTDFKIKQTEVAELRTPDTWSETSLTFDQEGSHTVKYLLKRDGRSEPLTEKSVDINIDKSAPTIAQPIKGADGKSFSIELGDSYSGIATVTYNLNNQGNSNVNGITSGDKSYTLTLSSLDYGTHSIVVTVTDVAGHSATESRTIELKDPTPPVVPDPPVVNPTPVYYEVTLPAVEGATTDPVAGSYTVESWSNFIFRLTLDEGYKQHSKPVVTTDRGETLEPRDSDGAYLINYVRTDVMIHIEGIVPDQPTANAEIDSDIRIRTVGGTLLITVPTPVEACITDLSGRLIRHLQLAPGDTRIDGLAAGIYIVKLTGHEGSKVIIR